MERIDSFSIDHIRLKRGIYVSRRDAVGSDWVTTIDIRMKEPNREPVIDMPALHTIEHLGATWLRNNKTWGQRIIYFGPMGCRTGCYLLLQGRLESRDIVNLLQDCFRFMANYSDTIPGASAIECGNHLGHDLPMAMWECRHFLEKTLLKLEKGNLHYPA